jgi:hypothetical protein
VEDLFYFLFYSRSSVLLGVGIGFGIGYVFLFYSRSSQRTKIGIIAITSCSFLFYSRSFNSLPSIYRLFHSPCTFYSIVDHHYSKKRDLSSL